MREISFEMGVRQFYCTLKFRSFKSPKLTSGALAPEPLVRFCSFLDFWKSLDHIYILYFMKFSVRSCLKFNRNWRSFIFNFISSFQNRGTFRYQWNINCFEGAKIDIYSSNVSIRPKMANCL